MRIGIDIRAIGKQRTGDETYTLQLVRHLANIDLKNSYFLYTDTQDLTELARIEKDLGLKKGKFSIISVLPASKALWTFWSLPRQVRKDKLDVLHVQYITPIKISSGAKITTTIHDLSFMRYPELIKRSDLLFLKLLIPPSLKHADRVIAISEFTKKEIIKYFGIAEEKIDVIKNGGAGKKFFKTINSQELEAARNALGVAGEFIFYVGTLQPRKNIPFLLKGFAELKKRFKDDAGVRKLSLVVGGIRHGHNYDRRIDDELEKLPDDVREKVVFPGFIDEDKLPAVYRASRVFCFPSLYEGFGLPIIESMSSGIPVVCPDSSSLGEISGDAAIIYKENDLDDFIEKLYHATVDRKERAELIEKGKVQASKFSWDRCASETQRVYENLSK